MSTLIYYKIITFVNVIVLMIILLIDLSYNSNSDYINSYNKNSFNKNQGSYFSDSEYKTPNTKKSNEYELHLKIFNEQNLDTDYFNFNTISMKKSIRFYIEFIALSLLSPKFQYNRNYYKIDQFENNVNEKILTNSEHFDMKMVSIILLDMLKLILCRYYILYLNDPEKIQIMTMRLSLKNSDNHINSYNITICIILTLKYIYENIGYNQLLFSVKDLYQIFSELNNHPDDEIEYISKQWFNTIRKNSEVGNI